MMERDELLRSSSAPGDGDGSASGGYRQGIWQRSLNLLTSIRGFPGVDNGGSSGRSPHYSSISLNSDRAVGGAGDGGVGAGSNGDGYVHDDGYRGRMGASRQDMLPSPFDVSNARVPFYEAMDTAAAFRIPLVMPGAKPPAGLLTRRPSSNDESMLTAEDVATADVATAISRDLVGKAERWKLMAGEPLMAQPITPLLANGVDKHEMASIYVKDALAGRHSSACVQSKTSLRALKWFRNKTWNMLLNICTLIHLTLPMVQIQRCLPCLGPQKVPSSLDSNALFIGWQPTALGSMWIECVLCLLYACHLRQEAVSRLGRISDSDNGADERDDEKGNDEEGGYHEHPARSEVYSLFALPPWQLARTCMVTALSVSLLANMVAHYAFGMTWFSWRHLILPFLFISRRTYVRHYVAAAMRIFSRMLPVAFLILFITFFYGFLGHVIYRHQPHDTSTLSGLGLFDTPGSSAMTFLRIFTARSFMLDVDKIYGGGYGVEVMVLSYGVIMFILLIALVPAVASHNLVSQSKESYSWAKEQRKLALTRAFMLLRQPDGSLARDDYVQLMVCLRPDCDRDHTSALFSAAKQAEEQQPSSLSADFDRNHLSKAGFFMLCALGTADFSRMQNERMKRYRRSSRNTKYGRGWARARAQLNASLSWSRPGSTFPVSQQVLNVALLIQAYQIEKAGDDPEGRPVWAYPLGAGLICYFCVQSVLRMIAGGVQEYFSDWRNILETSLNVCGIAYYTSLWPSGQNFHNVYQILQASRLELLWINLHLLGPASSDAATRVEFVFPAVTRASFMLFAFTYAYAVVAYGMYCSTPLGQEPIGSLAEDAMVKRFVSVKDVASFASLPESFASMMYIVMFSNWTVFMDAAGQVGNVVVAKIFFFTYKIIGFYFILPVLLVFSVQSYSNVQVPAPKGSKTGALSRHNSDASTPLRSLFPGGRGGTREGGGQEEKVSLVEQGSRVFMRRASFGDGVVSRNKDGTKFGYSTLVDGAHKEIDVAALAGSRSEGSLSQRETRDEAENVNASRESPFDIGLDIGGLADDDAVAVDDACGEREKDQVDVGDSSSEEGNAPVVVASRARSLSQTFWAAHTAKDGATSTPVMRELLARQEAEIARLTAENDSLRAGLGPWEASTRQYVAEMKKETLATDGDMFSSARRAAVDVGVVNAAGEMCTGEMRKPLLSTSPEMAGSLRSLVVSSAKTIWGMEAVYETEGGEESDEDLV